MKAPEQGFVFAPELRIFDAGSQIGVMFDTQSPADTTRASRFLRIPKEFEQLTFKLVDFDDFTEDGSRRVLAGKIQLSYVDLSGVETDKDMADCRFSFNAPTKADKSGAFAYPDPKQIKYTIRQALSDAFTGALDDYSESVLGVAVSAPPAASSEGTGLPVNFSEPKPRISRRDSQRAEAESISLIARRRKQKTILAWVLPPIIVIIGLAGMQWLAGKQSPIENAVAQQMANDPEAIKAQVNLVNETLRSMNLDPGQGGDLGCLAPQ